MSDAFDALNELEDRISKLEEERDAAYDDLADIKAEVEGMIHPDQLTEHECRRCHHVFRGLPDDQWCSRDCRHGWTPAPSYEEWYRSLPSHPRSWRGR